ncbi:MAG: class I SAM-dependent methyltransferase, partial [Synergistaceae bacterium]|nr:class I SAM-dependent methyltransferase [Synergistaceae bacterium]
MSAGVKGASPGGRARFDERGYWDCEAERFSRIYGEDGGVMGCFNRLFRGDMDGRLRFAIENADMNLNPEILEIGCGTGVHTKAFIDAGASFVTGIDISPAMLRIASAKLSAARYAERSALIEGDFEQYDFSRVGRVFGVATAIGVLDYVSDAKGFLRRAADMADRVIATFPRAGTFRSRVRKARLSLKGRPVYFYTKRDLDEIREVCGAELT